MPDTIPVQDIILVQDGIVTQVWRGCAPRSTEGLAGTLHEVDAGTAVVGMRFAKGRLVPVPPAYSKAEVAAAIMAEAERVVAAALGSTLRQASMHRHATALLRRVATGGVLTTEEAADAALLYDINAWENDVVAVREALIAAGAIDRARDPETWPSPPVGVTPAWLTGF